MSDLRDVKVGDVVYVVAQSNSASFEWSVARVGRKYGYLKLNKWSEDPFDLSTGYSHHDPNHNVRVHKRGFDVYRSKEEYEKFAAKKASELRLCRRLAPRHSYAVETSNMPSELVAELHEVLDKHNFRTDIK